MEKRRRRRRKPLSIEMIMRRSFKDCIKEYVKNCSLPGVAQMCDPKIDLCQRLLWIVAFLSAIGTCIYFLLYTWSDTLTKPLIVTMESSTYPIKNVNFPAVALCNINRISTKALQKLAEDEYPDIARGESLEEVKNVLLRLGNLIDYSYNESISNNPILVRFVEKYRHDSGQIVNIMKKLAPSCEEMILKCGWEGVTVNCDTIFFTRRTYNGFCCTFNYVLDFEATTAMPKKIMEIKRQREPGSFYGLNVIADPMLDDYAYPTSFMEGFDVFIFSPLHYAEPRSGRVIHQIAQPDMALYLELKSTKQIATREVKKYSLATRRCLFHDERKSEFGNMYSYSMCIVMCRINTIQSLCKCTPFNMATKQFIEGPICSLDNLKCLNKYREKLMYLYPIDAEDVSGLEMEIQDSLYCDDCWPDCEMTEHHAKGYQTPLRTVHYEQKDFRSSFIGDLDMTNKTFISIFHPTPDSTLDRLDVVYYWFEILCSIGGFSGIVLGFSIFSIVEIFYFLTIRFTQNCIRNFRLYR